MSEAEDTQAHPDPTSNDPARALKRAAFTAFVSQTVVPLAFDALFPDAPALDEPGSGERLEGETIDDFAVTHATTATPHGITQGPVAVPRPDGEGWQLYSAKLDSGSVTALWMRPRPA
jgi:hypothetical protein